MGTDATRLSEEVIREALQRAAWDKRRAQREYRTAVETAHAHGWGHTKIARTVGVTEAAVRNLLRRKPTGRKPGVKARRRV